MNDNSQIARKFKDLGYSVWIDHESMYAGIADKMACAVENCRVFVACVSQAYADSRPCKDEFEYAVKKKKSIIPVIVADFSNEGWLGKMWC